MRSKRSAAYRHRAFRRASRTPDMDPRIPEALWRIYGLISFREGRPPCRPRQLRDINLFNNLEVVAVQSDHFTSRAGKQTNLL